MYYVDKFGSKVRKNLYLCMVTLLKILIMALRFSFFNSPKHKVFNYQPLYFDPEKERREQRRAQLLPRTREERLYYPGRLIRGSFQKALYENRRHAGDNRYVRIVIVLSIVILFIAVIYFADGLRFLFNAFPHQ